MDRNDNFNSISQSPNGAATCATPSVDQSVVPIAGGDLGAGASSQPIVWNSAPFAGADSASVAINTDVTVLVLANDTDVDGDPLQVSAVEQPSSGTAAIVSSGSAVRYTASSATGSVRVRYTVSDGNGGSGSGVVSVTVYDPAE